MRRSLRSLVPIGAALAAIALVPGSAAAKCRPSIGHPVRPGYLLIIDGEMRGEYQSAVRPPLPPSEEIASLTVVCPESQQVDAAAGARQMVVAVVTREGLPRVLQSYLNELVRAQAAYHAREGAYATDLEALRFFRKRPPLPINMAVSSSGWFAYAQIEGYRHACRVVVRGTRPDPVRCTR